MNVIGQSVSAEVLDEIVERLVALASPIKIILFGSNARGEAQLNSDLDLLVVEKEVTEQYSTSRIKISEGNFATPSD